MLYRHKGFIFGISLVIVERALDMMDINPPQWVAIMLLMVGSVVILWTAYLAWKGRGQESDQPRSTNVSPLSQTASNILQIERPEPSKLPPLWIRVIGNTSYSILLAVAVFQTYLVLSGRIDAKFNWDWIGFYLVFGLFPLIMLLEPYTFDRKYYKSGRSATAVEVSRALANCTTGAEQYRPLEDDRIGLMQVVQ